MFDSARRRSERDLHEGAQQRLLTVSYQLRLARAAASADGDAGLVTALASACDPVQAALEELRDLAHGIYPVILTEAGLGPALLTLADEAPLPVEVTELPNERLPEAVERAAYIVGSSGVDAAARQGANHVEARSRRDDGVLVVCVGRVGSSPPVHLADRVGALGGSIGVEDGILRAEIPCV